MINLINCTPHDIVLNNRTTIKVSGHTVRIEQKYTSFDKNNIALCTIGNIIDLPEPKENTLYIVSGIILAALKGIRSDVIAPATGHPDVIRSVDKKIIISVPGFIKN